MPRFEIQHYTLCDGWVNTWTIEYASGSQPDTYPTYEDAEDALNEFFEDQAESFEDGDMDELEDRGQYRIAGPCEIDGCETLGIACEWAGCGTMHCMNHPHIVE